jgi:hypothetical protein
MRRHSSSLGYIGTRFAASFSNGISAAPRVWKHIVLGREELHTISPSQQITTVNRQDYDTFLWKTALFKKPIGGVGWVFLGLAVSVVLPFIWHLHAPMEYALWGLDFLLLAWFLKS